jgi:hypothetical protein
LIHKGVWLERVIITRQLKDKKEVTRRGIVLQDIQDIRAVGPALNKVMEVEYIDWLS